MTANAILQYALYFAAVIGFSAAYGPFMARVYDGRPGWLGRVLGPLERAVYRSAGVDPDSPMDWRTYAAAALAVNLLGVLAVYALERLQGHLPLDPAGVGAVVPRSAFNAAVSFATNTNWQDYGGETTMSYLTQMLGLTVQNFLSAAAGMAVLAAFVRGLVRREKDDLGNFWADLTRSTLYILLPLACASSLVLVCQGVPQDLAPAARAATLQGGAPQVIARGPVASQVAIKQLGTNGGGYYNANSAHPLENPTPLSGLVELWAILALPGACCVMFGEMVGDRRQGWAVLAAMTVILVPLTVACAVCEQRGNPLITRLGVGAAAVAGPAASAGGNMEGKEVRFGVADSALWAAATTAASNGSVDSMHDSYTPLGGLVPLFMMQLGEVVYGGVGSGLYGMLVFAIVAVFVAGLMVGRTPEYLGKKIEAYEMKMASLVILVPPVLVLVPTALAVVTAAGRASLANPGAHGFSEALYAFSSMGNNNGSAFAGLNAATPFYDVLGGLVMLVSRYWIMVPALAIAGSLSRKKLVPAGEGTLPTHTPLFVALLVAIVLIVGALTFVPALALGPVAEHLAMVGGR